MSKLSNRVVTASAPGKVILSGEHAVVYGKPALALAVNRFATTTITAQPGYGFWFEFLDDGLKRVVTMEELQNLKVQIAKRCRKYTVGKCRIKEIIHNPLELIQYAFIYLVDNLSLAVSSGLKIQVSLTIPIGCGMGGSAAVILSMIHALVNYYEKPLTADKYLYFGREIENLQHGRSSGVDLFLSFHGGCYFFTADHADQRRVPQIPLVLVNTGRAETSTGECVEQATKYLQDGILLQEFSQTTQALDLALQQDDLIAAKKWVRKNHELLQSIAVVPKRVANFIAAVAADGSAAKISGSGAIAGDNAGIVLVLGEEQEIAEIVTEYGYTILSVKGESRGLRLI